MLLEIKQRQPKWFYEGMKTEHMPLELWVEFEADKTQPCIRV